MTRKLKTLGLALIAVFAMSAVASATASAVGPEFHSGATSGTVKGTNVGEETFTVTAGTVKCSSATYTGTYSASTVTSQIVTPAYSGCVAFGFVNTPIDVNGCQFRFNQPTEPSKGDYVSTVDIINCTKPMEVTAANCTVTIGNQAGLSGVTWDNVTTATPSHLTATTNISGIKYTQDPKGEFLPCNSSTDTNGTYVGTNTVKAFNGSGTQVSLSVA
jgi:hypothetical protein